MAFEDRELRGGTLRWLNQDQITDWRRQKIADLHNTEGRRVVVTDSFSTDKSIEPAEIGPDGNPVIMRPPKTKPRTGRETAELMTQVIVRQWLELKRTEPEAFRKKLDELRALSPATYSHMSDDELEGAVVEVCRRQIVEPMVAKVAERSKLYQDSFYRGELA